MNKNQKALDAKTKRGQGSAINHFYQTKLTRKELSHGDISDRVELRLSDGRTTLYIKKGKNIEKVRLFWEAYIESNLNLFNHVCTRSADNAPE